MPSRQDPFGEMDHIKAVPLDQARTEYKEAVSSFSKVTEEMHKARRAFQALQVEHAELEKQVAEKSWQLGLSALED